MTNVHGVLPYPITIQKCVGEFGQKIRMSPHLIDKVVFITTGDVFVPEGFTGQVLNFTMV